MSQKKINVKGVLEWLRNITAWWSQDPLGRLEPAVTELTKNKSLIKETISEVIEPEFKEYVEFITGVFSVGAEQSGTVAEPVKKGEGTDNKADSGHIHSGGEEGQAESSDKVQHVVKD